MHKQFRDVDTKNLPVVCNEVVAVFRALFTTDDPASIGDAFGWAEEAFGGRYADYQPIDAKYHDLEHTLQGALCLARLLEGYQRAGTRPALTPRIFELGVIAILLHDTGYLKRKDDRQGTGAKYTLVHVTRSAEFAAALLKDKAFPPSEI